MAHRCYVVEVDGHRIEVQTSGGPPDLNDPATLATLRQMIRRAQELSDTINKEPAGAQRGPTVQ
jgi:hypothetical protein